MASLQNEKRRQLQALLRAQVSLPLLVEHLSRGLIRIDSTTACHWAGWIDSLVEDPAWELVEPALQMPQAWPEVWRRAREAGFSTRTEHHHGIFFVRLFERALEASRHELARHAWSEAMLSWASLSKSDYLAEIALAPVAGTLTDDELDQVQSGLLDSPIAALGDEAMEALRLNKWSAPPSRRSLSLALEALDETEALFSTLPDSALGRGALQAVVLMRQRLSRAVIAEVEQTLEKIDISTGTAEDFLKLFDGALLRTKYLAFPPELNRFLLRRGLGLIWDLREVGRDKDLDITASLVERLEGCADRILQSSEEQRLGLEGSIADLFVFKGEEAFGIDDRQAAYEEALRICPGHRNASRLLSILLLERANRDLLKTVSIPVVTARVGTFRRKIESLLKSAGESIERAEELHPENELLGRYRDDLRDELERFGLYQEVDYEDR